MQYTAGQDFPGNMNLVVLGEYDVYKTKPPIVDLDANLDYTFDGTDLGALLGRWGDPYDGADLALLLGNWGSVWHRQDQSGGGFEGRYYVIPPGLNPVLAADPDNPNLSYLGWGPGSVSFVSDYRAISGETRFPGWAEHARAAVEYVDRVSAYIIHNKSLDAAEGIVAWQQSPQQSNGMEVSTTSPSESSNWPLQSTLTMSSPLLGVLACFLLLIRAIRAKSSTT